MKKKARHFKAEKREENNCTCTAYGQYNNMECPNKEINMNQVNQRKQYESYKDKPQIY